MGKQKKPKKKNQRVLGCSECNGKCCRYFALQLDTPEEPEDFDNIRWYLSHKKTSVFVENGKWFLQIDNPCVFLCAKTDRCLQYPLRPKICRQYSQSNCDLNGGDYDYELRFLSAKQMEEYMRIKFGADVFEKLWNNKSKKQKRSKKSKNHQ